MKKLLTLIMLFVSISFTSAQDFSKTNPTREELKAAKKQEEEARLQKQLESVYQILSDSSFALEADFLQIGTARVSVSSNLNFVMVDSRTAFVQYAGGSTVGNNGLGGRTEKGKVLSYKVSKNNKKKNCSLNMTVETDERRYNFGLIVNANGKGLGTIVSLNIAFDGKVVPLKESKIIIGQSSNMFKQLR